MPPIAAKRGKKLTRKQQVEDIFSKHLKPNEVEEFLRIGRNLFDIVICCSKCLELRTEDCKNYLNKARREQEIKALRLKRRQKRPTRTERLLKKYGKPIEEPLFDSLDSDFHVNARLIGDSISRRHINDRRKIAAKNKNFLECTRDLLVDQRSCEIESDFESLDNGKSRKSVITERFIELDVAKEAYDNLHKQVRCCDRSLLQLPKTKSGLKKCGIKKIRVLEKVTQEETEVIESINSNDNYVYGVCQYNDKTNKRKLIRNKLSDESPSVKVVKRSKSHKVQQFVQGKDFEFAGSEVYKTSEKPLNLKTRRYHIRKHGKSKLKSPVAKSAPNFSFFDKTILSPIAESKSQEQCDKQENCLALGLFTSTPLNDNKFKICRTLSKENKVNVMDSIATNGYINRPKATNGHEGAPPYTVSASNGQLVKIAPLFNIGNTCYLNSVIYTLRFAPLFVHSLHHLVDQLSQVVQKNNINKTKSSSLGRNITGLQGTGNRSWSNKDLVSLGYSNGELPTRLNIHIATEKLHELFQCLHRNEVTDSTEAFHADTFLQAIQDVSPIFEGNQQQDAHEFLMCILDTVRETCQSLKKIISETPESLINGVPEQTESIPITQSAPLKFLLRRSKRMEEKRKKKLEPTLKEIIDSTDAANEQSGNQKVIGNSPTRDTECGLTEKDKLDEKIRQMGLDFVTENFEGITVSTTKCLTCDTITEQKETMIDLAVPISGNETFEANDTGNQFFQKSCITREHFRGENKYRCESCAGYTEAIRSISFEKLPRLLVIHLKRFSGGMEKISSYIPTPFLLQCFCSKCVSLPDGEKLHEYKLYSVITHVGATMSVGHYIAYTCSLDCRQTEYQNCPKEKKKLNDVSMNQANSSTNVIEKNTGLVKKMFFGRSKSSNTDVSKNLKNLNGTVNGAKNNGQLVNDMENLKLTPVTCGGLNCCSIHMKSTVSLTNGVYINGYSAANGHHNNEFPKNGLNGDGTGSETGSYESANSGSSKGCNEPIWYVCDDEKIKAISQHEFEDLLSSNQKITVTPYLLFYARNDTQNTVQL